MCGISEVGTRVVCSRETSPGVVAVQQEEISSGLNASHSTVPDFYGYYGTLFGISNNTLGWQSAKVEP